MMTADIPLADYTTQRSRFISMAETKGGLIHSYPHPLSGPKGELLYTDVALFGSETASRMMLVISGTHGVEGYYGSESQIAWLAEFEMNQLPADTALLFIHLLNPWGTAHLRRVNEDNIDLNRGFIDFSQTIPSNQDYLRWHDIYSGEREFADRQLASALSREGWPALKRVVEAGQYQYPTGLFYGGNQPSWSMQTMQAIIERHLSRARTIISFDLHTGAGAWAHPMLLSIAEQPFPAHAWGKRIYKESLTLLFTGAGRDSDTGVTATATGYLSQFLLNALPDTQILPLVVECGTYPAEEMHRRLRNDHWLHLKGNPATAEGQEIKRDLVEAFWPADEDWRALVALRTQQYFARGWRALLNETED
ncbi:M14 family metallopeptidase [Buttiauxella sp. A2-C2_NF]|uniref:DUF2817 domain-containing protein n=1 Tax=Buttiauxella ferragutiae TaxID=82989 RepID=UPI001E61C2F4|nr:DUF2817 domain-containing protein [Buttiauxella ferragutiae]MCE0826424.1 M14 family metallopeptidase [Buttiauxella ferragutiae]